MNNEQIFKLSQELEIEYTRDPNIFIYSRELLKRIKQLEHDKLPSR